MFNLSQIVVSSNLKIKVNLNCEFVQNKVKLQVKTVATPRVYTKIIDINFLKDKSSRWYFLIISINTLANKVHITNT